MADAEATLQGSGDAAGRRSSGRRILIHVGAAVVTFLSWWVLLAILGAVAFGSSVCGTATAGQVWDYRYELLKYGLIGAAVPLVLGALIHRLHERSWPWFALGVIAAVFVVVSALHAQVSQFCF